MIEEAYCSYDVSILLKEKGFNEGCIYYYDLKKEINANSHLVPTFNKRTKKHQMYVLNFLKEECVMPTHQLAMAWLREKKNLIITIDYDRYPVTSDENKTIIGYGYNIQTKGNPEDYYSMSESVFNDYEEAVEAALKYCLTKLI